MRWTRNRVLVLVSICVLCAIVRVTVALAIADPNPPVDPLNYDRIARNLLDRGVMAMPGQPNHPTGLREPLYPAFLAGCYFLFGVQPMAPVIVQSILGSAGAALFALIVLQLVGTWRWWIPFLAAGAWLVSPLAPIWAYLMREDLINLALLGGILLAIRCYRSARVPTGLAALIGLIVSVSMLVKASAGAILPVLAAILVIRWRWRSLLPIAAMGVVIAACTAPWMYRNYVYHGQYTLAVIRGTTLYLHSGQPMRLEGLEPVARKIAYQLAQQWPEAGTYTHPQRFPLDTIEGWSHFAWVLLQRIADDLHVTREQADLIQLRMVSDDIRTSPGSYLARSFVNFGYVTTGGLVEPLPEWRGYQRGLVRRLGHLARHVVFILVDVLALVGWWVFRRKILSWLLMSTALVNLAVYSFMTIPYFRYRQHSDLLMMAVIAALAAAGLLKWGRRRSNASPPKASRDSVAGSGTAA